jgi:hypothetical protein
VVRWDYQPGNFPEEFVYAALIEVVIDPEAAPGR